MQSVCAFELSQLKEKRNVLRIVETTNVRRQRERQRQRKAEKYFVETTFSIEMKKMLKFYF